MVNLKTIIDLKLNRILNSKMSMFLRLWGFLYYEDIFFWPLPSFLALTSQKLLTSLWQWHHFLIIFKTLSGLGEARKEDTYSSGHTHIIQDARYAIIVWLSTYHLTLLSHYKKKKTPLIFSLPSPNGSIEFISIVGTHYIEFNRKNDKFSHHSNILHPQQILLINP